MILKEFIASLNKEEQGEALQGAVMGILVYYHKQNLERNDGKTFDFKHSNWLGFFQENFPKLIGTSKEETDKNGNPKKFVFGMTQALNDFLENKLITVKGNQIEGKPYKYKTYSLIPTQKDLILGIIGKIFKSDVAAALMLEVKNFASKMGTGEPPAPFKSVFNKYK